ncbi:MAG: hypothetical protein AAF721_27575 [Myxococcota bacterium]
MLRWFGIALAIALAATPRIAAATTGGPQTLELLGYAPKDGKVYLLRHFHDESERGSKLVYIPLQGPHAGRTIEAKSWSRGDDGTEAFRTRYTERVEKLRARLQKPRRSARARLRTRRRGTVHWASPFGEDLSRDGSRIEVTSTVGDKVGATTVESFGCLDPEARGCQRVRIVRAASLPKSDAAVVLVEAVGVPWETGYRKQSAVLVR